jgi:hypothetical protein
MFPLVVRSDVSKSICNEFRCSFRLDSLLILLVTSLLTPGGNILLVGSVLLVFWASAEALSLVLCDVCFNGINVHLFKKKKKERKGKTKNLWTIYFMCLYFLF